MIENFKTYVKENLWSDLQDRSSGEKIRKEDEMVNGMDQEEFYNYMEETYIDISGKKADMIRCEGAGIAMPVFLFENQLGYLFLNEDKSGSKYVFIDFSFTEKAPKIYELLKKNFDITEKDSVLNGKKAWVNIKPQDGEKINNYFFIYVYELMLGFVKSPLIPVRKKVNKIS